MTERTFPPIEADERTTALAFLDYHRDTLRWKVAGLTHEQLIQPHPPSTMTLLGLVRHMAVVEDSWFTEEFAGRGLPEPWASVDWDADRDWEWHSASDQPADASFALLDAAIARSRAVVDAHHFDQASARPAWTDELFTLRWLVFHMIEEYARHNGHADLLREAIDGRTGE